MSGHRFFQFGHDFQGLIIGIEQQFELVVAGLEFKPENPGIVFVNRRAVGFEPVEKSFQSAHGAKPWLIIKCQKQQYLIPYTGPLPVGERTVRKGVDTPIPFATDRASMFQKQAAAFEEEHDAESIPQGVYHVKDQREKHHADAL